MSIPDATHPIWAILRQLIPLVVLGLMLAFNYNSVDHRDLVTILAVAASGGATESLGKLFKPKAKEGPNGEETQSE